jgi:hypothetical protein
MRRIVFISLVLIFLCGGHLYAQDTIINVDASVSSTLDFTWNMHRLLGEEDPWAGDPDRTAMSFGKLQELDPYEYPGRLFTDIWYCVFLWTTATTPYHIKQTSTSLATHDGQHNLDDSFVVIPDYNVNDKWDGIYPQGSMGTDQLGPATLVKDADILYYGNEGQGRIIRLYYSIPAEPKVAVSDWKYIPTNHATGDYEGTVTITITAQAP